MECEICLSKLSKVNPSITCCLCNKKSCKKCVKSWAAERLRCSCCNCNGEWSITFVYEQLGAGFINYMKNIQKSVLLKTELSFIPETTRFLALEREYYKNTREFNYYNTLYYKCKSTSSKELKEKYIHLDVFKNQSFTKIKLLKHIEQVRSMYQRLSTVYYRAYLRGDIQCLTEITTNHVKKQLLFKCCKENCTGFVQSDSGDCVACSTLYCLRCFEIKNENHTCSSETVQTIATVLKDSKPCPQCGTRISKIDGCYAETVMIPLWGGELKPANQIKSGDILIGDDATKRTVISTMEGVDRLYDIVQTYACTYRVNSRHSLALYSRGALLTLTVDQYLSLPENQQRLMFTYKRFNEIITITPFKVVPAGRGKYYGFLIDKNHQFLLGDFSVVRNCDQMYCTQCNTAWSWKTGIKETGRIHNPHYYEQLRNRNVMIARENETHELEDNIDDDLFMTLANDIIYHIGAHDEIKDEMEVFIGVYLNYLHNQNVVSTNNAVQYGFKTNYLDRLLHLKNKIDQDVFIKRCFQQYKAIQQKRDLLAEAAPYLQEVKKLLVKVIRCFFIIHETKNFTNTQNIVELYKQYRELKQHFTKKIETINLAYNNTTLSKIFIIE